MEPFRPSRTAFGAAVHRAAHQILERSSIFEDPLAIPILGAEGAQAVLDEETDPSKRRMRIFIAVRSRLTEEWIAASVARGVRQLVILGAGLDTFPYRSPLARHLQIFEVDHPATQAWKRGRLTSAGIEIPSNLTFASIDFERQALMEGLAAAGFDPAMPSFFTWLGVVPYLEEQSVWSTLNAIARIKGGAAVAFDYSNPPHTLPEELRREHEERAARVASLGEPWITFLDTERLHDELRKCGYREIDDWGLARILERFFPERAGTLGPRREQGGHIVQASTLS